jgi:hypothetical protein
MLWISVNNCTSLAKRLVRPQTKMWNVKWVIFANGYISKEEWQQSTQTFYTHYYSDPKRDVVQAYKYTLSQGISDNVKNNLQLLGKNMSNEIIPARVRLVKMLKENPSKKRKEDDDRLMSVQRKVPELKNSNWSRQSKEELMEALKDGTITEDDFTIEVNNLDKPIFGNGKSTGTKFVAQIGNYMVIDPELDGDCLYGAVILSNGAMIMGETLEEELLERAQELRMRMFAHLQELCENRQNLKMGTLLQKILAVMTQDEIDNESHMQWETNLHQLVCLTPVCWRT